MAIRLRHILTAPAILAASVALATAAAASTTISIKSTQVPVRASEFEEHSDCAFPGLPSQTATQWGWHFVLPGGEATFVTLTAHFADAGDVSLPGPAGAFVQDGKGAVIWTATDDTLTGAEATIEGATPQGYFVLSHTCLPAPTPTPSVSASETATPTPSESASETPSASVSATETASATPSATPSAEVSGTQFTNTPSESASVSPTVLGVKQTKGAVGGTGLPTTGWSPFLAVTLAGLLLASGAVLAATRPKGRYAR